MRVSEEREVRKGGIENRPGRKRNREIKRGNERRGRE